jgi:hypothetical protein
MGENLLEIDTPILPEQRAQRQGLCVAFEKIRVNFRLRPLILTAFSGKGKVPDCVPAGNPL